MDADNDEQVETLNRMQEDTRLARGTLQAIAYVDLVMPIMQAQYGPHALIPQHDAAMVHSLNPINQIGKASAAAAQ